MCTCVRGRERGSMGYGDIAKFDSAQCKRRGVKENNGESR